MIPHILYHGTTKLRWEFGIKQRGLRGDMPPSLSVDLKHRGYVYLTDNVNNACLYGLMQVEYDKQLPRIGQAHDIVPEAVVLAVRTSHIRNLLEPDPEQAEMEAFYESLGVLELVNEWMGERRWWRYFGTIPHKYIFGYRDVPPDKQPDFIQRIIKSGGLNTR